MKNLFTKLLPLLCELLPVKIHPREVKKRDFKGSHRIPNDLFGGGEWSSKNE